MAAGDVLATLFPNDAEFPSTSYPQRGVRNVATFIAFDDDADENCEFGFIMPDHFDGGSISVILMWMSTDQTTGTVRWDVQFKSFTDDADDLDTKAFATAQSVTATTASAAGEIDYATITFTLAQADSPAAGEYVRIKVNRDADNGSSLDTMTNDAELVGIRIVEA